MFSTMATVGWKCRNGQRNNPQGVIHGVIRVITLFLQKISEESNRYRDARYDNYSVIINIDTEYRNMRICRQNRIYHSIYCNTIWTICKQNFCLTIMTIKIIIYKNKGWIIRNNNLSFLRAKRCNKQ